MKKTFSISDNMVTFLENYARGVKSSQSQIIESALASYFQQVLGVDGFIFNRPNQLKGQTSIFEKGV